MKHDIIICPPHRESGQMARDYLRQEIAFFETRLTEMGERGDCAYERALSKAYKTLLRERREQLAKLNS